MECDSTIDPTNDNSDCAIFGGWPYLAMQYVIKAGGLPTSEDYPYCFNTTGNTCNPCSPVGYNDTRCGPGLEPPMCDGTIECREGKLPIAAKISDWKKISEDET